MRADQANNVFVVLSKVMEEPAGKTETVEGLLGDLEKIIDEKLIPVIEKILHTKKYEIIESVKNLYKDISLYLYFPELVNKVVVGFHRPPQKSGYRVIWQQFFEGASGRERTSVLPEISALADSVPTIIHTDSGEKQIKCLNLAEKIVSLTENNYLDLLRYSKEENIDLAGLLYAFSLPSHTMDSNQSFVVIPENKDIHNTYSDSVSKLIDILVIQGKECSEDILKSYANISKVFVYGNMRNEGSINDYCKQRHLLIEKFNSLSEIFDRFKAQKDSIINLGYKYCTKNILYEISWYLSAKKMELENPLVDINDNLLFKDDEESYNYLKNLQGRYSKDIDSVIQIYTEYRNICQEMIQTIGQMQESLGIDEDSTCINQHIKMDEILLELILKLSVMYKQFPEPNSRGILRNYCSMYKQNFGRKEVIDVILNDFLGNEQTKSDLEIFRNFQMDSNVFKQKKLDMRHQLSLKNEDCAKIISSMNVPLRSFEKRILGEYCIKTGQIELAKKYLFDALEMGDGTAGKIILDSLNITEQDWILLADRGVREAAFRIGKELDPRSYDECLKYLHIAASKNHLKAITMLGKISYDRYNKNAEKSQEAEEVIRYYRTAIKKGCEDPALKEAIGHIYYDLGNYRSAINYCEEADTAYSNYLLGTIYESGLGCVSDKKKALSHYEKAIIAGYTEAQTAYEELINAGMKYSVLRLTPEGSWLFKGNAVHCTITKHKPNYSFLDEEGVKGVLDRDMPSLVTIPIGYFEKCRPNIKSFLLNKTKYISLADYYMYLWFKNTSRNERKGRRVAFIEYYAHEMCVSAYVVDQLGDNYQKEPKKAYIPYARTLKNIKNDIMLLQPFKGCDWENIIKFKTFTAEKNIDKKLQKIGVKMVDNNWEDMLKANNETLGKIITDMMKKQ